MQLNVEFSLSSWLVGTAWEELSTKTDMVVIKCRISIPPDRSGDHEINLNSLVNYTVDSDDELAFPSTNKVSCTVHCLFSKPDAPPLIHTVLSPVSACIGPSAKQNRRGVWSTLVIWWSPNRPTCPVCSPSQVISWIVLWKERTALFSSSAGFWQTFVVFRP